jgi:hypothetical protein
MYVCNQSAVRLALVLDTSEVSNEMPSHLLKNDNQESIGGVLFDRIIGRYLNVIQKSLKCIREEKRLGLLYGALRW